MGPPTNPVRFNSLILTEQEHAQLLQSNQTLQQRVQQEMQEHAAVQTQRDQWQATAREHEEQAQAIHEELRTTRLAFQEQQAVCAPWAEELVGLRQLVSKQHAQLALFSDADQQVREIVRLQAEPSSSATRCSNRRHS